MGVICRLSWEDVKLTQFTCLLRSFCFHLFGSKLSIIYLHIKIFYKESGQFTPFDLLRS